MWSPQAPTLVGPFYSWGSNTLLVFFSHICYTWYTILSVLISFLLDVISSGNVGLSTFELLCHSLHVNTCPLLCIQRLVVILQQHILYFAAVKHNQLAVFCSRRIWCTDVALQVVCAVPLSHQQHKSKVWWNCICTESSNANMRVHWAQIWLHVGLHVKWSLKLTSINCNWYNWTVFCNILQCHI